MSDQPADDKAQAAAPKPARKRAPRKAAAAKASPAAEATEAKPAARTAAKTPAKPKAPAMRAPRKPAAPKVAEVAETAAKPASTTEAPAKKPRAPRKAPAKKPAPAPAVKPAGKTNTGKKPISLALQGGGSHGAFAWGVLDRIFEEDCFDVKGIVGTSAGAMNASVAAYGLARSGPSGAREKLGEFWGRISSAAQTGPIQPSPLDRMMGVGNMDFSPMFAMFDLLTKFVSPYQLNPMNVNPLRDVLEDVIDFDWMHDEEKVELFICASNVMTGKLKVFTQHDLSIEAVLASACLPFMFQAVEIEGEYFWDGGYMGNPPLYPLIYSGLAQDILIVQLNPIDIPEVPKTSQAILDRINTLSFNSSLMREMRVIDFVSKLIDAGFDDGGKLQRMFIHTISGEETLRDFGVSSKLNASRDFLDHLFAHGRAEGEAFLENHYDQVGVESSCDIEAKFF